MAVKYDVYLNVLFVADLGRARDFYQNVMGLECLNTREGVDAFFKIGDDNLLLLAGKTADDLLSPGDIDHTPARGGRFVMAAGVDDVDVAYEELRSKGAEFIRGPEDRHWGRAARTSRTRTATSGKSTRRSARARFSALRPAPS